MQVHDTVITRLDRTTASFHSQKGHNSLRLTQCYLRHKGDGEGKIL